MKYCTNFHIESFRQHEVDGKCLLKLDAGKIGMIFSAEWSEPILKSVLEEIGKLKIKTHHDEFKSYEFQSMRLFENGDLVLKSDILAKNGSVFDFLEHFQTRVL